MKKILLCLIVLFSAFTLASCDLNDLFGNVGNDDDTHTHDFATVTVTPTCTGSGYDQNTCKTCGLVEETNQTAALGHQFTDITVDPTCTEDGYILKACNVCKAVEIVKINKLGHDLTTVTVSASCLGGGYDETTCSGCGFAERSNYTDRLEHDYQTTYSFNQSSHWFGCKYCDKTVSTANHIIDGLGKCVVCNHVISPTPGILYHVSTDKTYASVVSYSGTDTQIVIADTYNGVPVTKINNEAFKNNNLIQSIVIPDSVTSIGDAAFRGCTYLTSVSVSAENKSYRSIDGSLYSKDGKTLVQYAIGKNKTSFNVPEDVEIITAGAFYSCKALQSVTIGKNVLRIGNQAFYYCKNLASITIQSDAALIDDAFFGCDSALYTNYNYGEYVGNANNPYMALIRFDGYDLETCNIHRNTQFICSGAFYMKGSGPIEITIPGNVTSIGDEAFYRCLRLSNITIPNSVKLIGDDAFYECSKLIRVNINDIVSWCNVSFGNEYSNPLCYAKNLYVNGNRITNLVIPEDVDSIGKYAFYNCIWFKSVTFPTGLRTIGNNAFSNCTGLQEVRIADLSSWCGISFGNIHSNPLYNAKNLYLNGELITELVIPDGVTSIGNYAFSSCNGLTSVTIPDSVTSIGSSAFLSCNGLTSVYITDIAAWCNIAFADVNSNPLRYSKDLYLNGKHVTDLVIPENVTSICNYAFCYFTGLRTVTLHSDVTYIGIDAFYYCSELTGVKIEDIAAWCNISFADYSSNPLYYAENLYLNGSLITDLIIPDGVTSIPMYAFWHQTSIKSITLPDSITSIGNEAFDGCTGLQSVIIGNNVEFIGKSAFYGCSGLIAVTIGNGVKSIDNAAFADCSNLRSVTIGNGVTSIGYKSFNNCSNLSDVYYTGSEAEWKTISIGSYNWPLTDATKHYNYVPEEE